MTSDQSRSPVATGESTSTLAFNDQTARDGRAAKDLLVAFEPETGDLTPATQDEISQWARGWLEKYPGAVVVMGCNGKARNLAKAIREARLLAIARTLHVSGVPEDRVRFTVEIVDVNLTGTLMDADRGVVSVMALRSAVLDASVISIRDLIHSQSKPV